MQHLHSISDRAAVGYPGQAVRKLAYTAAYPDLTVTAGLERSIPIPASGVRVSRGLRAD